MQMALLEKILLSLRSKIICCGYFYSNLLGYRVTFTLLVLRYARKIWLQNRVKNTGVNFTPNME